MKTIQLSKPKLYQLEEYDFEKRVDHITFYTFHYIDGEKGGIVSHNEFMEYLESHNCLNDIGYLDFLNTDDWEEAFYDFLIEKGWV